MNLLMLSGDTAAVRGKDGPFSAMLEHFAPYWSRIDVLCPPTDESHPRRLYDNVYLHSSSEARWRQALYIRRKGRELLADRPYHLLVSHDYGLFYNGLGAYLLQKSDSQARAMPFISEIHHIEGHPKPATPHERFYRALAGAYIPTMAERAAAIRVVNGEMAKLLKSWGLPKKKILTLPALYLDHAIFRPDPRAIKRYDALFVGRLASNKGLFTLLDALGRLKKNHPHLQFCILGEGALYEPMMKQVAKLGLSDNLTYIPRLETAADLAALYNQARVLVCASTSEGGPRVTVEAMACGTAVISTRVGVMVDLAKIDPPVFISFNGGAGELAKALQQLWNDEAERQALAERGREAVAHFEAEPLIRAYAEAYLQIAQQYAETLS